MDAIRGALAALVTGISAALVVVALAILPFLGPPWVAFAQARAQAEAWTGFTPDQLRDVTGAILADLVIGPPDFDVALDGTPVLDERERQHMRDVRGVFASFFLLAAGGAAVLVAAFATARTPASRARLWRRLEVTGLVLATVTIVGGVAGALFFDAAFEVFHRLFFPAGSYLFDPSTERLVQLFPEQFWVESSLGVGAVIVGLALGLAWVARRRGAALRSRAVGAAPAAAGAVPSR